jgi:hypothetical protein
MSSVPATCSLSQSTFTATQVVRLSIRRHTFLSLLVKTDTNRPTPIGAAPELCHEK